ncbi:hypothetical protein [Marinimicrobium agarilyticum]|uniref:hypothetical protein n=1 Tax=Marinimicrobium agarilyticum TaxID=306546 RepID=UPI0004294384|nr:hypothetical protein [Marinimicrobium agarilyticum]
MQFLKAPLTAISVATLVALVGCGGSSSGSGNTPDPTDPGDGGGNGGGDSQVMITGEAIKGVLKGAQVTAYELDEQGERFPNAVGTAQTDEQGEYELSLSADYTGGLIEVEVTAIDGQTTMVCDASRCGDVAQGEDVAVPGDFALRSIVEQEEGSDTVSASVTAWSTMAASRAKALWENGASASLKDARRQANAEVSQVVGFDVSRSRARGLSQLDGADTEQSQYALVNAAVAEIVFRDNGAESISDQLNRFTAALNDGRLGNDEDGFSSAELGQAVSRVITANAERVGSEASDALANQAARLESAGGNGFEPDYDEDLDLGEDASDADKIAAYKTFVGQTRTWFSSMDELSSEELTASVNIDEDTLRATMDSETQARFQFLGEVVGQVSEYAIGNVETLVTHLENGGTETIDIKDEAGNTVGQAELVFADNDGLSITAKGTATGGSSGAFVPFEVSLNTSIPTDDITVEHANGEIISARLARLLSTTEVSVNGQVGAEDSDHQVSLNNVALSLELDSTVSSDEQGNFDGEQVNSALVGASFSGDVAINSAGYRFNGDANVELVRLSNDARMFVDTDLEGGPLAPKSARLSGEFISANNVTRFNAAVNLNIRNAAAFDTFSWLDSVGTSMVVGGEMTGDDYLWLKDTFWESSLEPQRLGIYLYPRWSEIYAYAPAEERSDDVQFFRELTQPEREEVQEFVRTKVDERISAGASYEIERAAFEYSEHTSRWQSIVVLSSFENSDYYLQGSITASLGIALPEIPAAQVTATFNRTGFEAGTVRTNIDWDGGNYTLEIGGDNLDNPEALALRFFNAQGYELAMTATFTDGEVSDLTGQALIDGDEVGQVEWREGQPVLVFQDGEETQIESLF